MGCYVLLTNSNHPLVHELYAPFKIDVIQTGDIFLAVEVIERERMLLLLSFQTATMMLKLASEVFA